MLELVMKKTSEWAGNKNISRETPEDCPFDWDGVTTVERWNGTHTDGPESDFERKGNILVRFRGTAPESADDVIHFGKHKGTHWSQIPSGYVRWLAENVKGSAKKRAKLELENRR